MITISTRVTSYKDRCELLEYFFKHSDVSLTYIANRTGIPYATIGTYRTHPEKINNARTQRVNKLYDFLANVIGAETYSDIDHIKRSEYYSVSYNN